MSRFDINEQIVIAAAEYESKTGAKPKYLYLGFQEWKDFASYLQLAHGIGLKIDNNKVVAGLEVLYVPKPNHLGVGT